MIRLLTNFLTVFKTVILCTDVICAVFYSFEISLALILFINMYTEFIKKNLFLANIPRSHWTSPICMSHLLCVFQLVFLHTLWVVFSNVLTIYNELFCYLLVFYCDDKFLWFGTLSVSKGIKVFSLENHCTWNWIYLYMYLYINSINVYLYISSLNILHKNRWKLISYYPVKKSCIPTIRT